MKAKSFGRAESCSLGIGLIGCIPFLQVRLVWHGYSTLIDNGIPFCVTAGSLALWQAFSRPHQLLPLIDGLLAALRHPCARKQKTGAMRLRFP